MTADREARAEIGLETSRIVATPINDRAPPPWLCPGCGQVYRKGCEPRRGLSASDRFHTFAPVCGKSPGPATDITGPGCAGNG
jgi:hypothetical protein